MVVSDAGYYIPNERNRIKVAKWGTPKKTKEKKFKKTSKWNPSNEKIFVGNIAEEKQIY